MQTITLKWFGPYNLDKMHLCDHVLDRGIYAISRVWGDTETLLYIGRTKRELHKRVSEHGSWLSEYRGQIKVRVGLIDQPPVNRFSEQLLADTEALLIILNESVENTSNTRTYSGRALTIFNTGRRGLIGKKVSSESHRLEDIY